MRWTETEHGPWKKRFAFTPHRVGIDPVTKQHMYVWLEWYETRRVGQCGDVENRAIGSAISGIYRATGL